MIHPFHNLKQTIRYHFLTIKLITLAQTITLLFFLIFSTTVGWWKAKYAIKWLYAKIISFPFPNKIMNFTLPDGTIEQSTASLIAQTDSLYRMSIEYFISQWQSVLRFSLYTLSFYLLYPTIKSWLSRPPERKVLRGPKFLTADEYKNQVSQNNEKTDIPLGYVEAYSLLTEMWPPQMKMTTNAEESHMYVVGATRSGKTQLLFKIFKQLVKRKEKLIVHDYKGEYAQSFYRPDDDYIFNPLDSRTLYWNLFDDIKTVADVDAMAMSLFPEVNGPMKFWYDNARQVFAGIMYSCIAKNKKSNKDLYEIINSKASEIKKFMEGVDEAKAGFSHLEITNGNPTKQTEGTLGTLRGSTYFLKYFKDESPCGGKFSINKYLKKEKGIIFLINREGVTEVLRPGISLFIDTISRKILEMEDIKYGDKAKLFFMIDEFGLLSRMPSVVNLLRAGSSKGARVLLAMQDFAQIDDIYSKNHRQTIINNCGSNVILKVNDDETQKTLSAIIGESEFEKKRETSSSKSVSEGSVSKQTERAPLVLPSEIRGFKKLHGIANIVNYDPIKIKIFPENLKKSQPHFVQKPNIDISKVREKFDANKKLVEEISEKITVTKLVKDADVAPKKKTDGKKNVIKVDTKKENEAVEKDDVVQIKEQEKNNAQKQKTDKLDFENAEINNNEIK